MHRIEKFIVYNSKSFFMFVFAIIAFFFVVRFGFEFAKVSEAHSKNLQDISFVEGEIVKVNYIDTNTYLIVENCSDEFFIHTKYIKDYSLNVGQYVVIHYINSNPLSEPDCEIVNMQVNGNTIYTFEQYKQYNNPILYLLILIGVSVTFVVLVVLGAVFLKRNPYSEHGNSNSLWKGNDSENLVNSEMCEKVRQKLKNSFYSKNNRFYTSGLEFVESQFVGNMFLEVLAEKVTEGELKVFYSDGAVDDSEIFVVYQVNNKKAVLYLFADENTHKFHVDQSTLSFVFEKNSEPSFEELTSFINQVEYYNNCCENIFDIK